MAEAETKAEPESVFDAFSMPSFELEDEINRAVDIVKSFTAKEEIAGIEMNEDSMIPLSLMQNAKGLAFLTVLKVGFIQSIKMGTGLVLAKLPDGKWSAPAAIGTGGLGWGFQMGGQLTEFMLLLNDDEAVAAFSGQGNISLGAELGVAAGPVGRAASATLHADGDSFPPVYSYSHSKGLFAGFSLEGSVISVRDDSNESFYGKKVTAAELLNGTVAPPDEAKELYKQLDPADTESDSTLENLGDSISAGVSDGVDKLSAGVSDGVEQLSAGFSALASSMFGGSEQGTKGEAEEGRSQAVETAKPKEIAAADT